jgi:hypothetical protein
MSFIPRNLLNDFDEFIYDMEDLISSFAALSIDDLKVPAPAENSALGKRKWSDTEMGAEEIHQPCEDEQLIASFAALSIDDLKVPAPAKNSAFGKRKWSDTEMGSEEIHQPCEPANEVFQEIIKCITKFVQIKIPEVKSELEEGEIDEYGKMEDGELEEGEIVEDTTTRLLSFMDLEDGEIFEEV